MAYLKMPKDEKEIKSMTAANLRKSYNDLAGTYKKIMDDDIIRCVDCGEWLARSNFYVSKKYVASKSASNISNANGYFV